MLAATPLGFSAYKLFNLIENSPFGVSLEEVMRFTGKKRDTAVKAVSRLRKRDLVFTDAGTGMYQATGAEATIREQDAEEWATYVHQSAEVVADELETKVEEALEPIKAVKQAMSNTGIMPATPHEALAFADKAVGEEQEAPPAGTDVSGTDVSGSLEEMDTVPARGEQSEGDNGGLPPIDGPVDPPTTVAADSPPNPTTQRRRRLPRNGKPGRRAKYDYSSWPVQKGDRVKFLRGKKGEQTQHEGTITRLMVYAQQNGEKYVMIKPDADTEPKTTRRLKLVDKI